VDSHRPVKRRRAITLTAAIVAVYVAVAVATRGVSGRPVLPLFEGIGPPPAYRWVKPPAAFEAGNVKPRTVDVDFPLTGPAEPMVLTTPDGQFLVNLPSGAFPRHDSDTSVHATITPLDPATLGRLPAGAVADGNAYRFQLTYQPSATPVAILAGEGNVVMTAPHQAESLFDSDNGRSWTMLGSQHLADPTMIGATLTAGGYYLVGTSAAAANAQPSGGTKTGTGLIATGVVVAAAALGLFALAAVTRQRRARGEPRRKGRRRR
jgi:hypothetical protein